MTTYTHRDTALVVVIIIRCRIDDDLLLTMNVLVLMTLVLAAIRSLRKSSLRRRLSLPLLLHLDTQRLLQLGDLPFVGFHLGAFERLLFSDPLGFERELGLLKVEIHAHPIESELAVVKHALAERSVCGKIPRSATNTTLDIY